ncbi:Bcr/CflA family efflux MFS transporter [Pseudomonas sp. NPDC089758]|uniref:Bcr/CflA family efflux MFS transporter n=1 Tax=Pseudomonas sp. NPDC089758 TaxID=3364473 RepID=UPI0038015BC5
MQRFGVLLSALWSETGVCGVPAKTTPLSILLVLISLLGVFPLDVILPSVAHMAEYFAVDTKRIAYSVSLFALGVALSQAVIGPLSDCVGRKRLLIAGLLLGIVGAIGCLRAVHYETFMVFRLLQAMGCGCFVLSQALVQDSYSGQQRDAMRILLTSASGVFIALSPLAGSVLQHYGGWKASFQVFVMLATGVLLLCFILLEDTGVSRYRGGFLQGYCQVLKDRTFLVYSLFSCLAFACHFSFVVVSPLLLMGQLGLTEFAFSMVFLLYGLAYMVGGVIANKLNRRLSTQAQIGCGFALIGAAGVALHFALSGDERVLIKLVLPLTICTIGTTIVRPAATTYALSRHPDRAGTAASVSNTLLFACGGGVSLLVASSGEVNLATNLAASFIASCLSGLLLLAYVAGRFRHEP